MPWPIAHLICQGRCHHLLALGRWQCSVRFFKDWPRPAFFKWSLSKELANAPTLESVVRDLELDIANRYRQFSSVILDSDASQKDNLEADIAFLQSMANYIYIY